jgi:2-methylfumaryl-CoA isomerase
VLRPFFESRRVEEFADDFDNAGVTWSVFRTFAQAAREDPDLTPDNPMFAELEQPGIGTYAMPGSPLGFSGSGDVSPKPAPELGQHTEEILADVAGLGSGEIGKLFDQGVVAGPKR